MHESPGAFASAALALHARGLAVLPVGGENGKRPLVKHWSKWRTQTRETVERLIAQHPEASIAINCGPSRLTVVDADDENALADAEARFGYSPLVVRTPRGGGHLYYRNAGEGCPTRLRVHEGLNVDIKGRGGYVLAPPSRLPHGAYRIERGGWDAIRNLPRIPPGAIPELRSSHDAPRSPLEGVLAGDTVPRNNTLFDVLRPLAPSYDDFETFRTEAHRRNQTMFAEHPMGPLPATEVDSTVV